MNWFGQPVELKGRNGSKVTIKRSPMLWWSMRKSHNDPIFRSLFPGLGRLHDESMWWRRLFG